MWFYRFVRHFFFLFTPARRQLQPGKTGAAAVGAPARPVSVLRLILSCRQKFTEAT
jgi:hypothetical protein